MIGTREIQPAGQKMPNIRRVGIKIGKPLDFSRYDGMENDRFVLRSMTDEIMYELMELSGQEYVDLYASRAKEVIADGESVQAAAAAQAS
jgi:1-acyl-sn-glycerol-3-phosphate acyltransferase